VLDLSKVEAGKLVLHSETLTSSSIIEQVMPNVDPLAKKNHNELIVHAPQDYVFLADRTRFCQVLLNLLSNACKFTEGGTVTIEVYPDAKGKKWLCWSVSDTGIGIPKESYNKLFRPFSQVDSSRARKHEGTGLGLTISQHFCELMGGRIEFTSELGKGSRFVIFIPAAKDADNEELEDVHSRVSAIAE
jgi:signal transduction histidine kinase